MFITFWTLDLSSRSMKKSNTFLSDKKCADYKLICKLFTNEPYLHIITIPRHFLHWWKSFDKSFFNFCPNLYTTPLKKNFLMKLFMSRIVPVYSYICSILNSSFPFLKFKSLKICFVLFSSLNSVFRSLFWIFLLLCSNKRFLFSTISWIKIDFFLKSATWISNQTPHLLQWTNGLRCAANICNSGQQISWYFP